jgi:hypothetical protein
MGRIVICEGRVEVIPAGHTPTCSPTTSRLFRMNFMTYFDILFGIVVLQLDHCPTFYA